MENDNIKKEAHEVLETVAETWKGLLLSAGMTSGLFSHLGTTEAVSSADIAKKTGYDKDKLDHWFYYMELTGFVAKSGAGYILTSKGKFLTPATPAKDLLGMANLTEYYADAAIHGKECFFKNRSLDKLSEGRISRDYQPKVSDNFSTVLFSNFKDHNMSPGDSVLDVGCGNASFLRNLTKFMPDLQLSGVDSNLFAIELGKKENLNLGLTERIKLFVGDITTDMKDFADESYDWVTAINVFHFVPPENRRYLIDNIIRIAKKGVFMNEGVIEPSPITSAGNPLMFLLYNDFTGFFKMADVTQLNTQLEREYPKYKFQKSSVLQGTAYLITILKN